MVTLHSNVSDQAWSARGIKVFDQNFYNRNESVITQVGQKFEFPVTALEALERGGLDYRVGKFPLHTYTKSGPDGSLAKVKVPDAVVLIREPTTDDPEYRQLAVVGKDYHPVQNREIAATIQEMSKVWPIHAVAQKGYGEKVFWSLYTGDYGVKPRGGGSSIDQMRGYIIIVDHKDGTGALQVVDSDVRLACWNALRHAMKTASLNFRISHTSRAAANLGLYTRIMNAVRESKQQIREVYQHLAVTNLVADQLSAILDAAYPEPKPTRNESELVKLVDAGHQFTDKEVDLETAAREAKRLLELRSEQVLAVREGANYCYERFNDEHPAFARTAWAAYQAVVETEDWRVGRGNTQMAALFGERADNKTKAFSKCLEIAGVKN